MKTVKILIFMELKEIPDSDKIESLISEIPKNRIPSAYCLSKLQGMANNVFVHTSVINYPKDK
jgi:hypothetical protein